MRIFITYFLLIALLPAFSFAQKTKIDSLKKALPDLHDTAKISVYNQLAKLYLRISLDTSEMYAQLSVNQINKNLNSILLADAYGLLGTLNKNRGNYDKALVYHLKSKDIREQLKDEKGLATTYNDMGIVYKKMKRWDEALNYYRMSNSLALKYDLTRAIANTYNNIGTIFIEKQLWDSALIYYNKALPEAEKTGDNQILATVLTNLGDCYYNHDQYQKALETFLRCLGYDKQNQDTYGMTLSYFHIGTVLRSMKDLTGATLYLDSANRLALQNGFRRERVDILYITSVLEENKHNYPHALELSRLSAKVKDSILNEETSMQISELQTRYETSKKEQEIIVQKSELSKKNYIIGGISGLLLLGSMLGFSSYRRYKLKQQAALQQAILHQQEIATKAVIEAEEQERKRIAGDLHDGVGQLMSAARMNLSVVNSELSFKDEEQKQAFEKALALVDEGCREVRTVSHNIMPNALLKAGLASAIRDFINKIDVRVLKVNLYTEGINERLAADKETVLYRVIQECINNVIKHSGASQLDIAIIKDDEGISVTIEDNGRGFDTTDKGKFDGIGLKNIQTRINYLKGTVEWESQPDKGTLVVINIPG